MSPGISCNHALWTFHGLANSNFMSKQGYHRSEKGQGIKFVKGQRNVREFYFE